MKLKKGIGNEFNWEDIRDMKTNVTLNLSNLNNSYMFLYTVV